MNRAQVLGKTFLFPEQQVATQTQRTSRASGLDALTPDKMNDYFGIPEPAEGLQYTGDMVGRVQNYYQGLAALQQFAREQWTRYGVDVTNPDPTRQDSVMAAQAYQAALANLRTEGDMLKESQAMLKQVIPAYAQREYEFAQDTFNQPFAQVAGTQVGGQSLRVDPLVAFTGQQAGKDFTSYGQFQQAQQAVQGLQQQPLSERDRVAAQSITPDYTPRATAGGGTPNQGVAGIIGDWGQLSVGKHPSFRVTNRPNKQGTFLLESTDNQFVGKRYGSYMDRSGRTPVSKPFNIIKIEHDPDSGETRAYNEVGASKLLPKDISTSIKEVSPSTSINEIEQYLKYLDSQGILPKQTTQSGAQVTTIPGDLFVPAGEVARFQNEVIPQATARKQDIQALKQQISSDLDKVESGFWSKLDRLNFFTGKPLDKNKPVNLTYKSDYGDVVIEKKGGEYEVTVNGKLIQKKNSKGEDAGVRKFTRTALEDYLGSLNVYGSMLEQGGNQIATPIDSDGTDVESWVPENQYKVGNSIYFFNTQKGQWDKR